MFIERDNGAVGRRAGFLPELPSTFDSIKDLIEAEEGIALADEEVIAACAYMVEDHIYDMVFWPT